MKSLCRAHLPSRVRLSLREKVNPDLELEKADESVGCKTKLSSGQRQVLILVFIWEVGDKEGVLFAWGIWGCC